MDGEKETVVEILGVEGVGRGESVVDEGGLGFGAKKREITCCFCFPMFVVVAGDSPVVVGVLSYEYLARFCKECENCAAKRITVNLSTRWKLT